MQKSNLAELGGSRQSARCWLTTADVARVLERTPRGARWIVDQVQLACTRTTSGQRLFHAIEVRQLADRRAEARLHRVTALRPKRLGPRDGPHQMSLFDTHLRLVRRRSSALPPAEVHSTGSLKE